MVADKGFDNVEMVEQLQGDPCIFGGDKIHLFQRLNGAGGKIRQVADRGADDINGSAHRVLRFLSVVGGGGGSRLE